MNGALDPSQHSVPLAQLAAVEAALAEGFDLAQVLAIEGIDEVEWRAAEAAWKASLASAGGADLFAAYKAKLTEAEDRLSRRVAPLDEDLNAWASFLKVWSAHPSPFAFVRSLGIGFNDISRISRKWAAHLERDKALRARAGDIAEQAKPEVPPLRVEPAALRPSPAARSRAPEPAPAPPILISSAQGGLADDRYGTLPAVSLSGGPALPFGLPDPDAPPWLPPPHRSPPHSTGTAPVRVARELLLRPALPFLGAEPPPLLAAAGDINETAPLVDFMLSPALPFAAPEPAGDSPPLTLEQHASLTLELALYPERRLDVLRRYRTSEARLERMNEDFKRRFVADPALSAKWWEAYKTYHAWLMGAAQSSR